MCVESLILCHCVSNAKPGNKGRNFGGGGGGDGEGGRTEIYSRFGVIFHSLP